MKDHDRRLERLEGQKTGAAPPTDLKIEFVDVYMSGQEAQRVGREGTRRTGPLESMDTLRVEIVNIVDDAPTGRLPS